MGERHTLTEPELDDLERAAREPEPEPDHEPDPSTLLEKGPSPKNEEAAHTVLDNGKQLIEESESKLLDQSARSKGLSRYLEALNTVNRLGQESETVTTILADITWALYARQEPTRALMWALDKSGLVHDSHDTSEKEQFRVE